MRFGIAIVIALGVMPNLVHAQGRHALELYVGRNDALPDAPHLGGMGYTRFAGPIGIRGSAGISISERSTSDYTEPRRALSAWTADGDLVLSPLRGHREWASWLGGIAPLGFVGVGTHGIRRLDGTKESVMTWSYGFGASRPLISALSVEALARHREPLDAGVLPAGFSRGWEYRLGLAVNFGRRPARGGTRRDLPVLSIPGRVPRKPVSGVTVVRTADRYQGTQYKYGGTDPARGFDCSGFVQYVFARHDVPLPRTSRQMVSAGDAVSPRMGDLRVGDLVLFAQNGGRVDHVAIYTGNNRIIHSSASGGGVRYDDLASPRGKWFARRMVAVRRVIVDGQSLVESLDAVARITESLDPPDKAPVP